MARGSIRGITIEIAGNTSKLVKSLDNATKACNTVEKQLKAVNNALKWDPTSIDALTKKQEILQNGIKATTDKLNAEKEAAQQAEEALALGKISKDQYDDLQLEILQTTSDLAKLKKQAEETSAELSHVSATGMTRNQSAQAERQEAREAREQAKLDAEQEQAFHDRIELIQQGLGVIQDVGARAGDALQAGFNATVKSAELAVSAIKKVGEVAVDVVEQVGRLSYNLSNQVVSAYGEYEQLAGGVEKLFGSASSTVIRNADRAYRTAGMDANSYLQTVTSFSASLVSGLGGDVQQAADIADMALQDMSDNANTFGSDIASLQSAYQGLAKGQYNMLDNLRLGYGGSQREMVRLINDSGILEERISSLDNISFDQMIQAIHEVQTQLNITGTTAREAEHTIEGSINTLKASWQNLLIGFGRDDADTQALAENLADSFNNVVDNITPVLERMADRLPGILPSMIERVRGGIPDAVRVAGEVMNAVGSAIAEATPDILDVAIENLPEGAEIVKTLLTNLSNALQENAPAIVEAFGSVLPAFTEVGAHILAVVVQTIIDNAPEAVNQVMDAISPILDNIFGEGTGDKVREALQTIVDKAPDILENVIEPLGRLTGTVLENLPEIVDALIPIIEFGSKHLPEIVGLLIGLQTSGALAGVASSVLSIVSAISSIGGGAVITEITGAFSTIGATATSALSSIGTFAVANAGPLAALAAEVVALKVEWDTFWDLMDEAKELGISKTEAIAGGFEEIGNSIAGIPDALEDTFSSWDNFTENIVGGAATVVDNVVNTFGEGGSHLADDWAASCNSVVESTQTAEQQAQQAAIDIQLSLENSLSNSALTAQEKCNEILSAIDQLEALGQREIAITIRERYQREIVSTTVNEGQRSTADYYATQGRRRINAQNYANSIHAQADRERAEQYRQQGEATLRAVEETARTAQQAISSGGYGGGGSGHGGGGGGGSSSKPEEETKTSQSVEILQAISDKFDKLLEKFGIQQEKPTEYQNNVNQMIDGLLQAISTSYTDDAIEAAKAEIAKTMGAYGLSGEINAETLEQLRTLVNSQPAQNAEAFTQVQNSVSAIQAVSVDYTPHFVNLEGIVGQILALKQSESDTINVYVGNELLDTYIQQSLVQQSLISGGVA